jgi:hypothetical protein
VVEGRRKVCVGARDRLATGSYIAVADFSGSRRLGKLPGTLADRVLEPGGAASCPLMAGSPVTSLPKGEGVSGGVALAESGGGGTLFRR